MYFRPKRSPKDLRQSSCGHRSEKQKQMKLRVLNGVQICASSKSKVARHTGHIEEFRKY
jgi:hypothetical protein